MAWMRLVRDHRFGSWSSAFAWQVGGVATLYLLVQAVVLSLAPAGWQKFFVLKGEGGFQYWDAIHYFHLAESPGCSAFFPLWPLLVRAVSGGNLASHGLVIQIVLSEVIFLFSLPLVLALFRKVIGEPKISFLMLLLYALGPNSIFYSIGYTESLFSLCACFLILCFSWVLAHGVIWKRIVLLIALVTLSFFLNLIRPALVQTVVASSFCAFFVLLPSPGSADVFRRLRVVAPPLSAILVGAALGYGSFGMYCLKVAGSIWEPFNQQVSWGRTLAFRPWLFVTPRSLLIDLHGLYAPALLLFVVALVAAMYLRGREKAVLSVPRNPAFLVTLIHPLFAILSNGFAQHRSGVRYWSHVLDVSSAWSKVANPVFLYCLAFSGVHSAINLAANSGYLYSTSRHFFASPFAFVAIGVVLAALSWSYIQKLLIGVWGVGMLLLAVQWFNWAGNRWVG